MKATDNAEMFSVVCCSSLTLLEWFIAPSMPTLTATQTRSTDLLVVTKSSAVKLVESHRSSLMFTITIHWKEQVLATV